MQNVCKIKAFWDKAAHFFSTARKCLAGKMNWTFLRRFLFSAFPSYSSDTVKGKKFRCAAQNQIEQFYLYNSIGLIGKHLCCYGRKRHLCFERIIFLSILQWTNVPYVYCMCTSWMNKTKTAGAHMQRNFNPVKGKSLKVRFFRDVFSVKVF